jgi:hypothetical protein
LTAAIAYIFPDPAGIMSQRSTQTENQPMPNHQAQDDRLAEELEGAKLRAAFQADVNRRLEQAGKTQKDAIPLLLEAYPRLNKSRGAFIDLSSRYAGRSDLKKRYSRKQITAYAAAEILAQELDLRPQEFHGMFTACCVAAGTHLPEKPGK